MSEREIVPCNGCKACCVNTRIVITQFDDLRKFRLTDLVPTRTGDKEVFMLKHKADGSCIYLSDEGCTIWENAPYACRTFDCRKWLSSFPEGLWRSLVLEDGLDGPVARAAQARLQEPPVRDLLDVLPSSGNTGTGEA